MFYRKPFVPPWRIQWSCCLQPCREMHWLWPTLYGRGLRHVLSLKDPATPSKKRARTSSSQVDCDDSSGHRTNVLGTLRGMLVLPKWWWLRPATLKGTEQLMLSASYPSDSFSDPEQPVATPSTLVLADFEVEETTGPPLSEAMAPRVCHILKTPLLPEKLKLRMHRELCSSN